jgi:hypothetical protein
MSKLPDPDFNRNPDEEGLELICQLRHDFHPQSSKAQSLIVGSTWEVHRPLNMLRRYAMAKNDFREQKVGHFCGN